MVGITSYGAYIPIYRLSFDTIGKAWGRGGGRGEKAVANWDEDSLTMGVEAACDCLSGMDRGVVEGLYYASTTPVYLEKQTASILAAAADLRQDLFTADFTDSVRAGTSAFRAAADAVKAGSAKKVMVVASDCRPAEPRSEFETLFGDGAAAFLIGDSDVAVSIDAMYTTSSEFMDVWRLEGERYHHTSQDRFGQLEGFSTHVTKAVSALFKKCSLQAKDFTKLVMGAPNARRQAEVARRLGFDVNTQLQNPLFDTLGHTGTASAPMMLIAALEEAKPGDKLLFVNWSDGVDAYVLTVTKQIEKIRDRRGIKRHMAAKTMLPYWQYIRYRDLMNQGGPVGEATAQRLWRERNQILRFHGQKCRHCGQVQYPYQWVCNFCLVKGDFEEIRLSDKKGTIFSFSMEERGPVLDPPLINVVVDFEGGGRFFTRLTDRDPKTIDVGQPVELTLRYIHQASGIKNYYWEARPVRC
ncbi:MAG: hydroxymethylglutaryl-CoA synthase [Chloroflexi bacterium]|nr:hydroxymethylglutaryl-CoA synthase [Chloroflexota bacterium]